MENAPPVVQSRPGGPGSLDDVAARHAAGPEARKGGGRPRVADDLSTPEGRAAAERREKDRAQKAGRPPRPIGSSPAPSVELFKPDNCRILVGLPFDVAGAALGSETWALDENEKTDLAGPVAVALNFWFPEADPKWASLTAVALAVTTITAKKYLIWKEEKKAKGAENEK